MYVESDTLLLADVFNNFQNICYEIYGLDPAHMFSTQELACKANSKNTKVKCHLLTDMDVIKRYQRWIISCYWKADELIINTWKILIKIMNLWILNLSRSAFPQNRCSISLNLMFKSLHDLHNDLPFLSERMKIEQFEKLVANLHDKRRICHTHKKFETY